MLMPGPGWYVCEVTATGPADDGRIYIALRHVNGEFDFWFYALPDMKREMLAAAL
jgi:hypothetical protein